MNIRICIIIIIIMFDSSLDPATLFLSSLISHDGVISMGMHDTWDPAANTKSYQVQILPINTS